MIEQHEKNVITD